VDDARQVGALDEVAAATGVRLRVLVEVDVGAGRCGSPPGEPVLALARGIHSAQQPDLRRLQG
jgi:D-serine deaminase-like pyridoxal phosphate-dependent protein